jgi:hypothetical protein
MYIVDYVGIKYGGELLRISGKVMRNEKINEI